MKLSDFSGVSGYFLGRDLTVSAIMNQVRRPTYEPIGEKSLVIRDLCCIAMAAVLPWVLTACDPSPISQTATAQETPPDNAATVAVAEHPASQPAAVPVDSGAASDQPAARTEAADMPAAPAGAAQQAAPVVAAAPLPETAEGDATSTAELLAGIELLGTTVPPGTSQRLMWSASQIFEGVSTETPVLVVNGRGEGPTLCLTAAIHGDELNGIEMVRQVMHDLDPDKLKGAVIGIPIVNLQGFRRGSRYLPDRRDLNRYFPGNPSGSSAARIANSLFERIIRHCDALVDLHTGSFYRTNLPQLRADLRHTKIKELTQGFGGIVVLHSVAAPGTLRRAATDAGIPAITLEAGEPLRLQTAKVSQGVTGIFTLLDSLDIVSRVQLLAPPEPVFYQSTWVRANDGGILFSVVRLGQEIETGDVLGTVTDPITNAQNLIYSPATGRILGMALNQVVMPGFAAFRIGIETDGPPTDTVIASLEWDSESSEGEPESPGIAPSESVEEHDEGLISDLEEPSE
jgi:predicted deacylase